MVFTNITQNQVGFSYISQKLNLISYSLQDSEIFGDEPHSYIKY